MWITLYDYEVVGFDAAIMGARKAFNSENKSDSCFTDILHPVIGTVGDFNFIINLLKGRGDSHTKCLRFVKCCMEIQAPRYWWQEFDTYKIGVERLSQSTIHTILKRDLTLYDFETSDDDFLDYNIVKAIENSIECINRIRVSDSDPISKMKKIKKILPESFLQTRIVEANYQSLRHIFKDRYKHKLDEWKVFCNFIKTLPYSQFITYGVESYE